MTFAALLAFEGMRLLLRAMLVVLIFHFVRAALGALREEDPDAPPDPERWPSVTVQLPMRNEFYVVERICEAACALDYPRDRFEIQVLDDSDAVGAARAKEVVRRLAFEGHAIRLLHRERPTGYKAGALAAGLCSAQGELVAMFDADCVPPADFLRRTVPWFHDPAVGCVQVRWSFLNRTRSLLTRVQAVVLDGLFAVDQFARSTTGLPLQFNGTNGIWRRAAIDDAGDWNGDVLAEDADLSFRAQMAGWRMVHLRDYAVLTEIPEDMAAFRAQQRRWAIGTAQLLRAIGVHVLLSRLSLRSKVLMLMHLGRHSIDPLILMVCVSAPLTTLYGMPYLLDYSVGVNAGLMVAVVLACVLFYGAALHKTGEVRGNVWLVPLVVPLAMGMSLLYTCAFFRGTFQRGGAFIRTPKLGDSVAERLAGPSYRSPVDPLALVEVLLAAGHVYFMVLAADRGLWPHAGFFALVAGSFAWVGVGSLAAVLRPSGARPERS